MNLQEKIKSDLQESIKNKNTELTNVLKIIIGEFQRGVKKELNDDEAIRILKKLEKSEMELLSIKKEETSEFLIMIKNYLPNQLSEEEVKKWIKENIDFSKLKNKMQAIGIVTKQFGQLVDGNKIKEIINNL